MYIMKRPSNGRGEYEIAENCGHITPNQILGHRLRVEFGSYGYIPTDVIAKEQGGKNRLRRTAKSAIQVQRQILSALLLPKAVRDENVLPGGQPTIMVNRYIVRRIIIGSVVVHAFEADMQITSLELSNRSNDAEEISVSSRIADVEAVHKSASMFISPIRELVLEHQLLMQSNSPLSVRAEQIVEDLMQAASNIAPDYDIAYVYGTDVLPVLKDIASVPPMERPSAIAEIAPDEIEVLRREAAQWRRWAASRGPESAVFRRAVREAYSSCCIICGLKLPTSKFCRVPGVDSAHILPWAQYNLDIVPNGLCLCKTHHWAFDQQMLAILPDQNEYRIVVTQRAETAFCDEGSTLSELRKLVGTIPHHRLPQDSRNWPSSDLLRQFYEAVPPR